MDQGDVERTSTWFHQGRSAFAPLVVVRYVGMATASRMPMTSSTTRSSMRVKPGLFHVFDNEEQAHYVESRRYRR